MTRHQLRKLIAANIAAQFDGQQPRADGGYRPALEPRDCEFISQLVYATIARSRLQVYEKGLDAPRLTRRLFKGS